MLSRQRGSTKLFLRVLTGKNCVDLVIPKQKLDKYMKIWLKICFERFCFYDGLYSQYILVVGDHCQQGLHYSDFPPLRCRVAISFPICLKCVYI